MMMTGNGIYRIILNHKCYVIKSRAFTRLCKNLMNSL